MGSVQRAPAGLLDVLSAKGLDRLPVELLRDIRPTLDLLQFYGLQQLSLASNSNAAAAEGVGIVVTPSSTNWTVLFAAVATFTKTATMTALTGQVFIRRVLGQFNMCVADKNFSPFGATETGLVAVPYVPPYPLLMPPGTQITAVPAIIGTDATANVVLGVEFGLFG